MSLDHVYKYIITHPTNINDMHRIRSLRVHLHRIGSSLLLLILNGVTRLLLIPGPRQFICSRVLKNVYSLRAKHEGLGGCLPEILKNWTLC